MKTPCKNCDGEGYFNSSECCGAEIKNGLCTECLEHSDMEECEVCGGSGEVETN